MKTPIHPGCRRWIFTGTLDAPANATQDEVRGYVERAVEAERGHLHPEDPMSSTVNVQVKRPVLLK